MNQAFKTLIESINAQIKAFNENDIRIYDADNPEYFISGIKYDSEDDVIKFETEEDPIKSFTFEE